MAAPLYDRVQFEANMAVFWDHEKIIEGFFSPKIGQDGKLRFVCTPDLVHRVSCKPDGYSTLEYAALHFLDQHLQDSYRLFNCLVCHYRGLQHSDLKKHMKTEHKHYAEMYYNDPNLWNECSRQLHRYRAYGGFVAGNNGAAPWNNVVAPEDIGLPPGNIGVAAGNIDVEAGNIGVEAGNIGVAVGNIGVEAGNIGVAAGNNRFAPGNYDVAAGNNDGEVVVDMEGRDQGEPLDLSTRRRSP